jgi:phosphoribosyl 1,2-cyclic phosphate phosphodiesterase
MKVTFLGTGTSQGVPVIACECGVCRSPDEKDKRLRSSVMVEVDGKVIVIDSGPDFRQQMLRTGVTRLDGLLLTHEHKDHIAGLDDIRAFNFRLKKKIDVYATEHVQYALIREFAYIFSDFKYPGIPEIELHTIDKNSFTVDGLEIIPVEVKHYRLPVLGFRIGDFTYITDANYIGDEEKKKIHGSKVLVLNALRRTDHISHFTLFQAVELIKELKPQQAFLTHISHQLGKHEDVNRELPEFIRCAYDGLCLEM